MKNWDYAVLSHTATENGGPENYIKKIETYNYDKGIRDGRDKQGAYDILFFSAVAATFVIGSKIYNIIRNRIRKDEEKHVTEAEAEEAKKELIQGMQSAKISDQDIKDVSGIDKDNITDTDKK